MSPSGDGSEPQKDTKLSGIADATLRLIAEARERGNRAADGLARRVANEIANATPDAEPNRENARAASPLRTLRREVDIALDEVASLLQGAMNSAESLIEQRTERSASIESLEVSVASGGSATTTIWIHNTTQKPWADLRPRLALAGAYAAHTPPTITLSDASLPTLAAQDSVSIIITIDAANATPDSQHHGLLTVVGSDSVVPLHMSINVGASAEDSS